MKLTDRTILITGGSAGRAAARRMAHAKRPGVVLMHTPEPARTEE